MYKYIKTRQFASLIKDDKVLHIPKSVKEIYSFEELPDMSKWKIGNTQNDETKLTWHELKDDKKVILICDRVLVKNISIQDLGDYVNGKRITIDGEDFICRLIYSGTEYDDRYSGTKNKDEWDYIIGGNQQIVGLPAIYGETIKYNCEKSDYISTHNLFWNWSEIGTLSANTKEGYYTVRGLESPDFIFEKNSNYRGLDAGWRPVLEKVIEEPVIDAISGRLGEFIDPFSYKYTLKSYNPDESFLNTVIKLDGSIIEQDDMPVNTKRELDLSEYWNGLYKGRHTIEIITTNEIGLSTNKIASFNIPAPTFVDKDGLIYYTQQFWNTKIKPFVSEFSKRQGGLVLDANENFTGSGQIEVNNYADCGKAISTTIDTTAKTVALFSTDAIKLGKHGLVLRGSVSNKIDAETLEVIVRTNVGGSKTEIARTKFKSSQFKNANSFSTVYMSFEYATSKVAGQLLEIEIKTLTNSTSHNFKLDYVLISPVLPGVIEG